MPLLSNYFKVPDIYLGIISLAGDICCCVMIMLATSPLVLFLCKLN